HRGRDVHRSGARLDPAQAGAGRGRARGGGVGLAAGGPAHDRAHGGGVHAEREDRLDDRADPGHARHAGAGGRPRAAAAKRMTRPKAGPALRKSTARVLLALLAAVVASLPAAAQAPDTGGGASGAMAEALKRPSHPESRRILTLADADKGAKVLVSTEQRRLWLVIGRDTVLNVPVAVGMGR